MIRASLAVGIAMGVALGAEPPSAPAEPPAKVLRGESEAVAEGAGSGAAASQAVVRIDQTYPIRRHAHCAAAVGPKVYVFGGISNDNSKEFVARVDCLDTRTGEWTSVAPMPTPRAFAAAAELNGKVYVIGGMSAADRDAGRYSDAVECYDAASDTWSPCKSLTTPRSRLAAAATDGKVYALAGMVGSDANPADTKIVDVYYPKSDNWESLKGLNEERHALSAAVSGGRVWAVGGYMLKRKQPMTPIVESMNPKTATFRVEKGMPLATPRAWFALVTVNDSLLALGSGGQESKPERLARGATAWRTLDVPDIADRRFAAVAVGSMVYVLGGEQAGDRFVRVFDAAAGKWLEP